jgi:uncharacterized protein (TIGR02996 family)
VTEDEAFIREIVDRPGDDLPRLVYADWLDERNDPRGAYLRAEMKMVSVRGAKRGIIRKKELRRAKALADGLDPIWVARVSRPPLGVCCVHLRFGEPEDIRFDTNDLPLSHGSFELPPHHTAFKLNYYGELLVPDGIERDEYGSPNEPFSDYPRFDHPDHSLDTVEVGGHTLYHFATQPLGDIALYYLLIGLSPGVAGKVYQADHEEDIHFGDLSRVSENWEGEYANHDSPEAFLASLHRYETLAEYLASLIPFDTPFEVDDE